MTEKSIELNVKRLYLPGVVLKQKCKKCGKELTMDLSVEYLSYPCTNEPFAVCFGCDSCEEENMYDYVLGLTLTGIDAQEV